MANKNKKDDGNSKKGRLPLKSLEPVISKTDVKKSKFYEPNVVKSVDRFQSGILNSERFRWTVDNCVVSRLKDFHVFSMDPHKFFRRITAVKWHPTKHNLLALGSKCGEVVLRNVNELGHAEPANLNQLKTSRFQAITNFCFNPFSDDVLLMSSVDGTISAWNYSADAMSEILDLNDGYVTWYMYCSVNASEETGLVIVGDSVGMLTLLSKDLKPISKYKVHKAKVNTAELCKKQGNILATASLDKTVKLWDIRMIGKEKVKSGVALPLESLELDHPINSAYFSKTDNNRLLLTDQKMQLRVYTMPFLSHESTIFHPHRQFQHLTPIKASWHPLADLIVIGRYPDPSWPNFELEQRTIDIIDAKTGQCEVQMLSPQCNSIMSLNEFNLSGEYLASGMGLYVAYWKMKRPTIVSGRCRPSTKRTSKGDLDDDDENGDDDDEPKPKRPTRPPEKKKPSKTKTDSKSKKAQSKS